MGSVDNFSLRWNDFENNISKSFRELRNCSEFFDVTLCCDNGNDTIQAHKLVLASCSPFFRRILSRTSNPNPYLYLKGIQIDELQAVLNFMYQGEVNIAQESLNKFLSVAEELAVKGLTISDAVGDLTYLEDDSNDTLRRSPKKKRSATMADPGTPKRKFKQDIAASQELFGGPVIKDEDADKEPPLFESGEYEDLAGFEDDMADFNESLNVAGSSNAETDSKEKEEATFLRSQKGQPLLMDRTGYLFCANRKTDKRIYWKCQNSKKKDCKARALTEGFFITKKSGFHTHQPNPGYSDDKGCNEWAQSTIPD